MLEVHGGLDVEELAKIAGALLPGAGATIMATARELIEQGRAQGKAEGRAEGVLAGRRTTLKHLLTLEFRAAVTAELLARVDAADAAMLDHWEGRNPHRGLDRRGARLSSADALRVLGLDEHAGLEPLRRAYLRALSELPPHTEARRNAEIRDAYDVIA